MNLTAQIQQDTHALHALGDWPPPAITAVGAGHHIKALDVVAGKKATEAL